MKNTQQVDNNIENSRALDYLYESRLLIRKNNTINRSYKSLLKISALFITTGITLEGARQAGFIQKIIENQPFFATAYIDYAGFVIFLTGIFFLVMALLIRSAQRMSSQFEALTQQLREKHLVSLKAVDPTIENLARIRKAGASATGVDTFVTIETLQWLAEKNRHYINAWAHSNPGETHDDIACCYIVAPLTQSACKKMLNRGIRKNKDLLPSDVCSDYKRAAGIYIIEVYGAGRLSRAAILYLLRSDMIHEILHSRSIRYLFARPVNDFGLKQVSKLDFQAIGPHPYDMKVLDLYSK
ncbi:MAG: hypothetical protein KIS65_08390 [Nitrosomonas sp.]|nr:hypothetical protein [Nitrosomonas sp.]